MSYRGGVEVRHAKPEEHARGNGLGQKVFTVATGFERAVSSEWLP